MFSTLLDNDARLLIDAPHDPPAFFRDTLGNIGAG
jgi:hypothetical protein